VSGEEDAPGHPGNNADAGDPVDETLAERVAAVLAELPGVARDAAGPTTVLSVAGRAFAAVSPELLEAWLDPAVARAALATPDTRASTRGGGWVSFTPAAIDRFALDRAEAWLRSAHRRASASPRGN
jgi:hypothetical protein